MKLLTFFRWTASCTAMLAIGVASAWGLSDLHTLQARAARAELTNTQLLEAIEKIRLSMAPPNQRYTCTEVSQGIYSCDLVIVEVPNE